MLLVIIMLDIIYFFFGYNAGCNVGCNVGYNAGYKVGYKVGYNAGYNVGYNGTFCLFQYRSHKTRIYENFRGFILKMMYNH